MTTSSRTSILRSGPFRSGPIRSSTGPSGLLTWRAAAGLIATAAGAAIITGALLPWVQAFAGLIQISGIRGGNGRLLAGAGAVIAAAGIWQLVRGGQASRWVAGLAGFAAAGFSGYLLLQLTKTTGQLGGDSMVLARGGPGLPVVLGGSLAAFATLLLPPSGQAAARPGRPGHSLTWAADRRSTGLRRGLQVTLGLVWLLDAALQYQPYMFTRAFPVMMIAPGAAGQPGIVAGPVTLAARLIAGSPAAWNAVFATVQLALAAGLFFRATTRAALAGTVAWALSVWWLGEGAGGIFTGAASPLAGAPGAALLYALLAVLIWPVTDGGRPGGSVAAGGQLGRYAKPAWVLLWAGMAALTIAAPHQSVSLTSAGGARAEAVTIAFAAAFALAAAGILVPALTRPALVVAVIAAAALWGAGEQFGGLLTGQATDPNSGPLLVLLALAYWPTRAPGQDGRPRRCESGSANHRLMSMHPTTAVISAPVSHPAT
jgi:hypothetical protein